MSFAAALVELKALLLWRRGRTTARDTEGPSQEQKWSWTVNESKPSTRSRAIRFWAGLVLSHSHTSSIPVSVGRAQGNEGWFLTGLEKKFSFMSAMRKGFHFLEMMFKTKQKCPPVSLKAL